MRFLSFFAVAVIATASLAVSGCTETDAPNTGGGTTTTAPSEGGSQSSTAPATDDALTTVSFDVEGMS